MRVIEMDIDRPMAKFYGRVEQDGLQISTSDKTISGLKKVWNLNYSAIIKFGQKTSMAIALQLCSVV